MIRIKTIFFLLIIFSGLALKAQKVQQSLPEKTRVLFLFDASGSMLAPWGNQLRIDVAKEILSDLVDSLRVNSKVELALRAYGHLSPAKQQNCEDTKLEIPFSSNNHDEMIQRLKYIYPKGTTPIAYSLEQAANDFPASSDYRNIIIIITDGIESCDGDPCSVSLALQQKRIFLKPFVIGLGMKDQFAAQFDCMGRYFNAKNINTFRSVLNGILDQSLSKTTASVELLDTRGNPTETDVNVSFVNNFTGISEFDFVHYRDRSGKPDTVEVDPVLTYDVVVNTIPPVVKKNVFLKGGTHNVIKVQSPQGSLMINQDNSFEYDEPVIALIRKANTPQIIHTQAVKSTVKYLVGDYDIELLTLPRLTLRNVKIDQRKTNTLYIPPPGRVNVVYSSNGIGSLYSLDDQGRQQLIKRIDPNGEKISFGIQPGNYKLVFRSNNALGSKYTQIKKFSITSGATETIRIY